MHLRRCFHIAAIAILAWSPCRGDVYNLKVVTDASPDFSDMDSMIHSITGRWETPAEKCWAMFYWVHIARRQTAPMRLHGLAVTDPIRQFNDYGYTMCSTVAGMNCAIWDAMGFPVRYWDITAHTVPEVFYDGRGHMYDNSLSAVYTLCDGVTIAGVEDIGKPGACALSGGRREPGHIARYHCLNATSPNGFLTGSDCARSLDQEYRCFNPNGLKHRYYYHDWDRGHRYILNVRANESYTRHYRGKGDGREFYIPNDGKDPDARQRRFHIRGNGVWRFTPDLSAEGLKTSAVSLVNARTLNPSGIAPARAATACVAVFKVDGANVITSQRIRAKIRRTRPDDAASVAVSTTNGLQWRQVWLAEDTGVLDVDAKLVDEVNGAYETLVRVTLRSAADRPDATAPALLALAIDTHTMLNSKGQPKLNLGENVVYAGAGEQTGSIVFWPELQAGRYKEMIVDQRNITSTPKHPGYQGTLYPVAAGEDAYLVYRIDAPGELVKLTYGGRFYNRAPNSHCDLLYSLDGGKTWRMSWSLTDTNPPWDVIHYETVGIPPGHRSVWVKYSMNTTSPHPNGCSIYAVRMEADYLPSGGARSRLAAPRVLDPPIEVTFNWSEPQKDRTLVERSHTQLVDRLPMKYVIHVGGADHPVMNWLRVNARGAVPTARYGYSDGRDVGGKKFVHRWVTHGRNLAAGKPYTISVPSMTNWGAGDPEGKKLTDGVVGPPFAGGVNPSFGVLWNRGSQPEITVDLGQLMRCGAFRINMGGGWPWWDALKGEVKDLAEVLTSVDGKQYVSHGYVHTDLRWKEIPINHFLPDDETLGAHMFELLLERPVQARYVRFKVTPQRMLCVNEVQVFDFIRYQPFDIRIALPDERIADGGQESKALAPASRAERNAAQPAGEPVLEPPTMHSLGVYWIIRGDENRTASIALDYRETGTSKWRRGAPLFRVERDALRPGGEVRLADDASLFAGSALLLRSATEYELRLRLTDPDGGRAERVLRAHTRKEPVAPAAVRVLHVVPGAGGGSGSADDPFRGLASAAEASRAGDLLLIHAGQYNGTFTVNRSGEREKPILWRGAGDGEAIIDGRGVRGRPPERAISASGVHDVWFERLTVRHARYGIVAHNSARIVVRGCHIYGVDYGLTCTNNSSGDVRGFFVADNLVEGPSTWPRTKGIENARGVQVTGVGHDVCYNRLRGFADAIDTFDSTRCAAIDFHHNDITQMTDDGIEMDYSQRNTRCFHNRLTNVFQGISTQPIFGGPVYIFRNVMYNVVRAPCKLHNNPSGGIVVHNTCVKQGMPLECYSGAAVRNFIFRNNLFIGTSANYAFESTSPMRGCDFDYDGFGGGPWGKFLKWNGVRYDSLEQVRQHAPVLRHATRVDPGTAFLSGARPPAEPSRVQLPPDLRLAPGSDAVDAAQPLAGFNTGFSGRAPDLGAYELGEAMPWYGPRRNSASNQGVDP